MHRPYDGPLLAVLQQLQGAQLGVVDLQEVCCQSCVVVAGADVCLAEMYHGLDFSFHFICCNSPTLGVPSCGVWFSLRSLTFQTLQCNGRSPYLCLADSCG